MATQAGKTIVVGILALLVVGLAYQTLQRKLKAAPPRVATPPANAEFLDPSVSPEGVMGAYLGAKPKDRAAVVDQFVGVWVPEPGWKGAVEGSADMAGTRAVSLYYYQSGIVGGGFWVYCNVSVPPDFKKGDHVRVTGQISAIDVLNGTVAPMCRIVLEPATVMADPPK